MVSGNIIHYSISRSRVSSSEQINVGPYRSGEVVGGMTQIPRRRFIVSVAMEMLVVGKLGQ